MMIGWSSFLSPPCIGRRTFLGRFQPFSPLLGPFHSPAQNLLRLFLPVLTISLSWLSLLFTSPFLPFLISHLTPAFSPHSPSFRSAISWARRGPKGPPSLASLSFPRIAPFLAQCHGPNATHFSVLAASPKREPRPLPSGFPFPSLVLSMTERTAASSYASPTPPPPQKTFSIPPILIPFAGSETGLFLFAPSGCLQILFCLRRPFSSPPSPLFSPRSFNGESNSFRFFINFALHPQATSPRFPAE